MNTSKTIEFFLATVRKDEEERLEWFENTDQIKSLIDLLQLTEVKNIRRVRVMEEYECILSAEIRSKSKVKWRTIEPLKDLPCTDAKCPVVGPHTTYNYHIIPRCHNPYCRNKHGGHWTKECPYDTINPVKL